MLINAKFQAGPYPAAGFYRLHIVAKDAGGAEQRQTFTKAQLTAAAELQEDGSYSLPVTFNNLAVGTCHLTAQCSKVDGAQMESMYGPIAAADITVSLADGNWAPVPVSFA